MGRPIFPLRLSAEERAALDRAAKAEGISTSEFVRRAALRDAGNAVLGVELLEQVPPSRPFRGPDPKVKR